MDTILIVDDSPTIRRMVKASLGAMTGTTFVEAASGLEAIEALAVSRVQLVMKLRRSTGEKLRPAPIVVSEPKSDS